MGGSLEERIEKIYDFIHRTAVIGGNLLYEDLD